MELIVSGGAPLGAELQSAVARRFAHAVVGQGWGLTETTACATVPDRERGTVPGSAGRVDEHGDVFVIDRLKELIKVNALQVAPAELEALLATHPAVADCAVVGRPDERRGEVPVAIVVARGELDGEELAAWMNDRVAPHKRLHDVRFTDSLPRTPAGKLVRRALQIGRRPPAS